MKLVLLIVAATMAIVAAFPTPQEEAIPTRLARAADPDPRHHYNRGSGGRGGWGGGYGGYGHGGHGYGQGYHRGGWGGYGGGWRHRRDNFADSNAVAGAISTPFGSGSFATASSGAGSGLHLVK